MPRRHHAEAASGFDPVRWTGHLHGLRLRASSIKGGRNTYTRKAPIAIATPAARRMNDGAVLAPQSRTARGSPRPPAGRSLHRDDGPPVARLGQLGASVAPPGPTLGRGPLGPPWPASWLPRELPHGCPTGLAAHGTARRSGLR